LGTSDNLYNQSITKREWGKKGGLKMEEKMNDLSIGTAISILVIVLAIISIGSIILAFEACPSQALNFSNNGNEEALDRTKIGDILANPAKYQFDLVTVIGEYRGWQGEGTSPPITHSDWVIKGDSGLVRAQ
jgi:hypothetical protein